MCVQDKVYRNITCGAAADNDPLMILCVVCSATVCRCFGALVRCRVASSRRVHKDKTLGGPQAILRMVLSETSNGAIMNERGQLM